MEGLAFTKMSGSGNDFILIDNREGLVAPEAARSLVEKVCTRRLSVGADGLILIESDPELDFGWRFFNADGSEVEMCGNGGRCAARFAYLNGIAGEKLAFRTVAGTVHAQVKGARVKLEMPDPHSLEVSYPLEMKHETLTVSSVTAGVPHVVVVLGSPGELEGAEVVRIGRAIRYHERYAPAGTNANFIHMTGPRALAIRTYERGVEDETFACGTGSIAAALVAAEMGLVQPPVEVMTMSGETLYIHFSRGREGFREVFLEGGARVIYTGRLSKEAVEFLLGVSAG